MIAGVESSVKRGTDGNRKLMGAGAFARQNWISILSWILFFATLGIWLIWYPKLVDSHALGGLLKFNAQLTGFVLGILGTNSEVSSTVISSPEFSMRIGHECTAIVPMVILLCAVVAYPSQIRQKLACIAIGLPVLFLLNLVRTITLYYVGVYIPDFFEIAHFVVWQSAMILAVIALWLFWVGKVVNVRST